MRYFYFNHRLNWLRLFILVSAVFYIAPGFAQSTAPLTNCNTPTLLSVTGTNSVAATVVTGSGMTWTGATIILASLSNEGNTVDADPNNYAVLSPLALGGTARITVQNTGGYYAAGTFAGFDIAPNAGLLGVDLLGQIVVKTYMGDTLKETKTLSGGLAGVTLLNTGSGRQRLGFKTTQNFNRIMIEQSAVLNLLGGLRVYGAVVERYCAGPALACNTNVAVTTPVYPVFTEAGTNALVAVNSNITNPGFAVDTDQTNYATVVQTVGLAANAEFEISDAVTTYNNTFAGFDIENPNLLNLGLLSNITVSAYRNDTLVASATGNNLLALNTGLLAGSGRQIVGFVPNGSFNSVRISFNQTLAITLGTTRIYGLVLKQFCSSDITCAQPVGLKNTANPTFPVYVNARRTGVTGVGCVACAINNTNNLIDGNSSTFATIDLTAGVLSTGSISVKNQLQRYPAGSYAGFEIESTTLLSANVLGNIKFKLYRNDTLVQDGTGQALLAGVGTDILTGGSSPRQIVGVISSVAFDEVQMEVSNLIAANVLGTIKVYEAYVETSCARSVPCQTSEVLTQAQHGAVINGANTGISGGVCAACKVDDPWNVVSTSTTDFSRLYNTVNALSTTSLGVAVPQYEYPAGTFAGFVIKRNNFLIAASLLPSITISTYKDGALQESKTGSNLLNLTVLLNLIGTDTNVYNAGFVTTMPFDEIKISMNTLVTALDQYIDVYGAFVDTRFIPAGTAGMACNMSNPDINVGYLNTPISGNVKTNDVVSAGTTYAAAVPVGVNPSSDVPVVNADGSYTFTPTVAGVYQFNIPLCENAICVNQLLTITVKDPALSSSAPVVNMDIATVKSNQSLVIHALANDYAGTGASALVPASMTLTDLNGANPGNTRWGGTATINMTTGDVTYVPADGFIGTDTIRYTVCDNQTPSQCGSAYQIITVLPATYSSNITIAADDYIQTYSNKAVSGNVKTNDSDPEGNTQTVAAQNVTIPGKGTFVLNTDGSYTFTPVAGFIGRAELAYSTCDNGTPSACAKATMYVLVTPKPVTNPDANAGLINQPVPGNVSTNDIVPAGTTYGTAVLSAGPAGSTPTMTVNADGSYSFQGAVEGIYQYDIPVCIPDMPLPCPTQRLTINLVNQKVFSNKPIVNPDIVSTANNTAITYNVRQNDAAVNYTNTLGKPTIATHPVHGTANVNADGTITYTPAGGFVGTDTLEYQVCETPSGQCGTAKEIITVLAPNNYNTLTAADDYVSTLESAPVNGNVVTNDVDAQGNSLIATTQNMTIPGKGSLVLNTNGSFTFTPVAGFIGTVDVPYTVCDNGSPSVCAKASLHILVKERFPDLTPTFEFRRTVLDLGQSTNGVCNVFNIGDGGAMPANSMIRVRIAKPSPTSGYTLTSNGTMTSITIFGTQLVDNAKWDFTEDGSNLTFVLKTTEAIPAGTVQKLGFTVSRTTTPPTSTTISVTAAIRTNAGGEVFTPNNTVGTTISSGN
ncbi:hypothetical protein DBR32_11330 [Taibaiella sp. KBW10]|uniref:Ig-like domain-containing protein n=1 Tax=Taibaiella sp. KBW10 TaxID=2153357 RepID=UPI000F5A6039|nr:Ig-like domain-containing protein [Taibaiella sp. KBW10]RQO30169.1 hypothetical protein DBR32_11330 [Taibaiella sp. KBW10]